MYNSVFFSIFTMYNYYHNLILEYFRHPQKKPYTH